MANCDMCRDSHERIRKAVWFHPAKHTEKLCDKCYKGVVKFYNEFKKKGGR